MNHHLGVGGSDSGLVYLVELVMEHLKCTAPQLGGLCHMFKLCSN